MISVNRVMLDAGQRGFVLCPNNENWLILGNAGNIQISVLAVLGHYLRPVFFTPTPAASASRSASRAAAFSRRSLAAPASSLPALLVVEHAASLIFFGT